ncbi:MAG: phosphoadenylyl-sulfate reductase [Promethearchaeota archaeon]|jgi:phosphoadenosine phosphosulfate reductase
MVLQIENMKIEDIKEHLDELNEEFEDKGPEEILKWTFKTFGEKVVLASSLGLEDQVLTDMSVKIFPKVRIFFLDTGRLNQETYDVLAENIEKYKIKYDIFFPKAEEIEKFQGDFGPNAFYQSLELRHQCCHIRKIEPLQRALKGNYAWITGLRRQQSVTRINARIIEWDEINNLIKINPLIDWCVLDVTDYMSKNEVPYNKLFDKGYTSIGCAPCTRPIKLGEDRRAGRWWWETPDKRECGLHQKQ